MVTYRSVVATRLGGPEVLRVVEQEVRAPAAGEVRIRVLAASVTRPDLTARAGTALYARTPLGQKAPFTPGYAVVGVVDAVGPGAAAARLGDRVGVLTVIGGYTEMLYWRADRLIPVPSALDPAEAVTILLNYIVAYQVLHRSARVQVGQTALVIGGSGGIGTALLQLGALARLKMYALVSAAKHAQVAGLGAVPIDYRSEDYAAILQAREPQGFDAVLDGMMTVDYVRKSFALLRRGGTLVSYGEPPRLLPILGRVALYNLLPNGRAFKLYGTSPYFLGRRRPFLQDWAALFTLLEAGAIQPVIAVRLPLEQAAEAHRQLESGRVFGNLALVTTAGDR